MPGVFSSEVKGNVCANDIISRGTKSKGQTTKIINKNRKKNTNTVFQEILFGINSNVYDWIGIKGLHKKILIIEY